MGTYHAVHSFFDVTAATDSASPEPRLSLKLDNPQNEIDLSFLEQLDSGGGD